ncbi:hypothetical protein BDW75DRAFT_60120 [Aspergillus navahoensis]
MDRQDQTHQSCFLERIMTATGTSRSPIHERASDAGDERRYWPVWRIIRTIKLNTSIMPGVPASQTRFPRIAPHSLFPVSEALSLHFVALRKGLFIFVQTGYSMSVHNGLSQHEESPCHTITLPLSAETDKPARRPGSRSNLSADPLMHACRLQRHIQTGRVTQSIIWGTFPRSQPAEPGRSKDSSSTSCIQLAFVQTFAGNTVITMCGYRNVGCVSLANHMTTALAAAGHNHNAESYRDNPYKYYPAMSKTS